MCGVQNAMCVPGCATLLHFATWQDQSAWGKRFEAACALQSIAGFER
jgi:hypothetical protein